MAPGPFFRVVPACPTPGKLTACETGANYWETMSSYWPTADQQPGATSVETEDGGPMDIGGATLAAAAMREGLIDEYLLVTHPVLIGGDTLCFTALDNWVNITLVETERSLTVCS